MKNRTIVRRIGSMLALAALLWGAPAAATTPVQASVEDQQVVDQPVTVDELVSFFSYWNVDRRLVLANVIAQSTEVLKESVDTEQTYFESEECTESQFSLMSCEDDCGDQYEECRYDCLDDPYNFEICLDDCEEEYNDCLYFC